MNCICHELQALIFSRSASETPMDTSSQKSPSPAADGGNLAASGGNTAASGASAASAGSAASSNVSESVILKLIARYLTIFFF